MAYAAAKFAESCLKAIQGQPGVVEYAYVSSHLTDLPFFASPLRLDHNGIAVCQHLCMVLTVVNGLTGGHSISGGRTIAVAACVDMG